MITVPFLQIPDVHLLHGKVLQELESVNPNRIACVNWEKFPYAPEVNVKVAQTSTYLILQYQVREKSIRAKYSHFNEAVWNDSCVEFFVSFDDRKTYYNFEFNCIGTPLLRYNLKPDEGLLASPLVLSRIKTRSTLGSKPFEIKNGDFSWELTIAIPYSSFFEHQFKNLQKRAVHVNFYKCGDELEEPHFLSLFPIHTPIPNFHVPEFFQQIEF
jgi:hypothetical protein